MSKYCPSCDRTRPRTAFSASRTRYDGLQPECKKCRRERRKASREKDRAYTQHWRVSHPESAAKHAKQYATKNADKIKEYRIKNGHRIREASRRYMFLYNLEKLYGMTEDEYDALLLAQGNRCGVCTNLFAKTPHIDHDHETGKVRGLLCNDCNTGLGRFKDDVSVLRAAVRYLKRNAD